MKKWFSLLGDNPSDVSVTTLRTSLSKRAPPTAKQYNNTAKMANSVIVNRNTAANLAVLPNNPHRCSLILQNNSSASNANDVPPILYYGFGTNAVIGQDLQLSPGEGLVLDNHCPSDAIYVTVGPITNGFGSVLVSGLVKENSITDPAADTANSSVNDQLTQLVALLQQLLAPKAA